MDEEPTEPTRLQLNPLLIPCEQCGTGIGGDYSFYLAKKPKDAKQIFVEMVRQGNVIELFGPAIDPTK